jgi:Bacterial regulatory proteins, luxR family
LSPSTADFGGASGSARLGRAAAGSVGPLLESFLRLLAAGGTNKEIAAALTIDVKTAMHHTSSIYRKLGVRGWVEAAAWAWRTGVVHSP